MVYTYIDANMNPAVTYYADKKRFGRDEDITSQQATSSKDQARKTQQDAAVTRDGELQRTNNKQDQHTFGPTLEQKFRQYLAAFDGKKKDFSEVEHLFDALFHDDFSDTVYLSQQATTKEQVKTLHARYFAMGTKAKLLDYRRVGLKTIDVSYHLFNEEEDIVTRQLITRKNCRVIRSQQLSYQKVSLNTDDVSDGKQFVRFNVIENSSSSYMKARWNSNAYREMAGLILTL
jgi:hypothetical protein